MRVVILLSFSILFEAFSCHEEVNAPEKCGGTFSGLQYPVTSPNYPEDYPHDQDCVYVLKASQSAKCEQEFHLQFLDFQLEASKACTKDYVKVGTESTYCGNSIGIRKFKGRDGNLKLIFHSDGNTTAKGFRILVTTLPCTDTDLDPKRNISVATSKADVVEDKESKNSYPVFIPEVKFLGEDEDQPSSRLRKRPSSPKSPSENLELPEFEQHDFHDEKCGHAYSANDDGIGSITSYLYLPPAPISRPVKITRTPSNSVPNNPSNVIPSEVVIRNFEEEPQVAEPPKDLVLPSHQIPPTFTGQVLQKTRESFQPLKRPQTSSQFYDSTNRWITYGTPNYAPPTNNPPIPNNNFDPFANDNYNPVTPNCGGSNGNPNYRPNDNNDGNGNPNYNPIGENFSPGSNVHYPNFGNGYPETGVSFDQGFGVNGNNNPGQFVPNGNYYPNNNFYSPVDTTYYNTGLSQCCGTVYSSSSFILANPGFPALIYSSSNYECQYTIRRSSENVCGLQMYLKFFNFGSEDQFCAYGYIEVDGSRICGCKTGANVTSYFDNIATKTITVKYLGYPRNKFSGFVIEVTQTACSTNYLRFGIDQSPILVRNWQRTFKRSLDNEEVPSRAKRNAEFFSHGENLAALRTSQNLLLNTCRIFKFVNWVKAAKQVYLRSAQCSATTTGTTTTTGVSSAISVIPIFPDTGNSALINYPVSSNCETVNVVDGTISSPYYPNGYANDLNQCYRFYKAPGYCQLELAILDFDLETSTLCRKDYVSFSGQKRRYCGTSLSGTRTIFDMTQATFADLYFVTDSSGTGRGFRAGFTQISC